MQLQENILFHNRYRLIKLLGRGGYSEVWLAEDTKTGLEIALKVYAPGTGLDEDGVRTFTQEFALVFNLNHGNLLKPSYFDEEERRPYLIMPYCRFGSITKMIGQMDEPTAWRFLHDVASGLDYLHSQEPPVIHQDIKPDNIMMDENHNFLITDFGISVKVRHTLRKSVNVKDTPTTSGTLSYMGPERFSRDPMPVKASDIWALGATVYELLEGDAPFGMHGGVILKSGAEIPDMQGVWSLDLKTIIGLCLSLEPWDRPTASQVVEWTEEHRHGKPCDFSAIRQRRAAVTSPQNSQTVRMTTTASGTRLEKKEEARGTVSVDPMPVKKGKGKVIAAILIGLVLLAGGASAFLLMRNDGKGLVGEDSKLKEFQQFVNRGDSCYRQAEESYLKFIEVAPQPQSEDESKSLHKQVLEYIHQADSSFQHAKALATDYNLRDTVYLARQMSELSIQIEFIHKMVDVYDYIRLYRVENKANVKKTYLEGLITYLNEALVLKEDPEARSLLNEYKNK
jgi:hypothetical protein